MFTLKNRYSGFTLIELMVVVIVMAILAAIAVPGYQHFVRKSWASKAEQRIQSIAVQLDRHKARNFNYLGFVLSADDAVLKNRTTIKYNISTDMDENGKLWAIKATSTDIKNYSFLMTSTGVKCKNITVSQMTFNDCGDGSGSW
ncbi:type IV pilin protein [Acinetobacter stercoris]|uniref:Type II secretion system protein G n=1 Tax=Acinetobacter stercoris TaxID=2126983 RepID=A0A2U3N100_9GAMM|nr:prepilin-type N-terminal cleavage/methylation domain-containing protein [Acinetobacter stercoris]SPL71366.1 Type II secretion system protein G precursor [Acinetobacter stercoris]